MNILFIILTGFLISFLGFYLRITKKDQGVDSWYYLNCVQEFKRRKKIPIKLSNYLLDIEEQWYPPGFIVFLSIFPFKFLKKYQWTINPLIDSFHLAFLYFFTYFVTHNILMAVLASLIYALTYTLIVENSNLNSRGFGSFLFTLALISLYEFSLSQNLWWLVAVIILGFFLLMSHKMATQALVFLLLGMALAFQNWYYLMILGIIFLTTFIFSKGFYWKVLNGHKEILMFWKKNLANLRAHQVYHSPIYKKENTENKKIYPAFHQKGMKGFLRHTKRLLGHNPWIVFIVFLPLLLVENLPLINFLFWWLFSIYFLIIITTYFPPLKFLGEGYKYIKFAIFPQSFLIASLISTRNLFFWLFLIIASLNLYAIFKIFKPTPKIKSKDLSEVIHLLKKSSKEGIMCLPGNLADLITFFTQKKVLWGTHSSGWNRMGEFFPILQKPIEYFFEKYNLNFLLLNKDFVEVKDLKLSSNFNKILENNNFLLLEYKNI